MRVRVGRGMIALLPVLLLLCGGSAAGQEPRDDWKLEALSTDLLRHLPHSLEGAPLTSQEREEIYRQIDADLRASDLLAGQPPEQERETVMGAAVGTVHLAEDGSEQVLVRAPRAVCGNGGCPVWLFVSERGKLRAVLASGGGALIVRKTTSRGFHDVTTVWHMGGGEAGYNVYRWNGRKYEEIDCYRARGAGGGPPVITDCPKCDCGAPGWCGCAPPGNKP